MEAVSIPMGQATAQNLLDMLDDVLTGTVSPRDLYNDEKLRTAITDECRAVVPKLAAAVQLGLPRVTVMTVDPPPGFRYSAGIVDIAMREYHDFRMKVLGGVVEACKKLPIVRSKNGQQVKIQARVDLSGGYNHLILEFVDVPPAAQ